MEEEGGGGEIGNPHSGHVRPVGLSDAPACSSATDWHCSDAENGECSRGHARIRVCVRINVHIRINFHVCVVRAYLRISLVIRARIHTHIRTYRYIRARYARISRVVACVYVYARTLVYT